MTNKEIIVSEPDVGLYARASRCERIVKRHLAPVVVVRMARDWDDVSAEVRGVMCLCLRRRARGSPSSNYSLYVVVRDLSS